VGYQPGYFYGAYKRGTSPSFKEFPLSCGTPCQERGIQGVRLDGNVGEQLILAGDNK